MLNEKSTQRISAIILAAGYSSRMEKGIKALLPFGKHKFMLIAAVEAFIEAQVYDIFIVLGHEHKKIREAIEQYYKQKQSKINIHFVYNADYDKGMLSSIQVGFKALIQHDIDASFLLPVDAALVRFSTIIAMKNAYSKENSSVLMPYYNNISGHPPLISKEHFYPIIKYNGNNGLRGYLQDCAITKINLIDSGILSDVDTEEEYNKGLALLDFTIDRDLLTIDECYVLMQQESLPDRTIRHSIKVALAAFKLAQALDFPEIKPQFALIAGLLHDIQKDKENHAKEGEKLLNSMYYQKLASAIATHTDMAKEILDKIDINYSNINNFAKLIDINSLDDASCFYACLCVYIADRFYLGDKLVSVEERFDKVKQRYSENIEALEAIKNREKQANKIIEWYEKCVQSQAMFIVDNFKSKPHRYEIELLKQFKEVI